MKRYNEFLNERVNWNEDLKNSARKGDLDGVKKALDNGADIHFNNDEALQRAIVKGYLKIVKYLIEQGADVPITNISITLEFITYYNYLGVINYLCEYIIKNKPQYIPKIMEYVPDELKEKYAHLLAASDMDLL